MTNELDSLPAINGDHFSVQDVDRSYLAYFVPTPRPFAHFVSGHFPPETITQPHSHPLYAMHGCLHEPLRLATSVGDYDLDAGDFCLIAPGIEHHWVNQGSHTGATIALLLDLRHPGRWPARTGIAEALHDLELNVASVRRFKSSGDDSLQHAFWQIADQLTSDRPRREIDIVSRLLTFISVVLGRMDESEADVTSENIAQQIRRLLMSRVNDRLTIADVARQLHVSTSQAKNEFRKTYGCGIMAYFNELKIWQAKRRLCDPNLTIDQISRQLGFSSAAYFSRAFLRHTSETPSEFRTKSSTN